MNVGQKQARSKDKAGRLAGKVGRNDGRCHGADRCGPVRYLIGLVQGSPGQSRRVRKDASASLLHNPTDAAHHDRMPSGDMKNLHLRQTHGTHADITREYAQGFGLDEIPVREFGKTQPAAVKACIDQQHCTANTIELHSLAVPHAIEKQPSTRSNWRLEQSPVDMAIIEVAGIIPDRNEGVQIIGRPTRKGHAVGSDDPRLRLTELPKYVCWEFPYVDIDP